MAKRRSMGVHPKGQLFFLVHLIRCLLSCWSFIFLSGLPEAFSGKASEAFVEHFNYNNGSRETISIVPLPSSGSHKAPAFPIHEEQPKFLTNCKWNSSSLWPPDPPGPTLLLGFLMTLGGFEIKERLGLKIPGMISYAVEQINKMNILPENYTLQIEVKDTEGDEILSTKYVTEMICNQISAFIGPESSCWVESSIAEARNIPMISYACPDSMAVKRKTFARTNPSEEHVLLAAAETIVHFNWTKISIIYEDSGFHTMARTLKNLVRERNITINHFIPFHRESQFPNIFAHSKEETRIYVLIGHRQFVPRALLAMTLSGLLSKDKKDYFLLYIDREEYVQSNWIQYVFEPMIIDKLAMSNGCLSEDLQAYEDSFMVITNTLPRDLENIEDRAREYNRKEPFCLSSDINALFWRHVPFLPSSYLYDAVFLYATAVRELYDEAIERSRTTGENVDVRAIASNGTGIIEKFVNRTYTSILGFNVTMGPNRASRGSYSVYYFQRSEHCSRPEYYSRINCNTHCLVNISDFRNNKLNTNLSIPIKDEPLCGYGGEKCQETSTKFRLITLIILSISISIVSLFSIQKYRHWKYEQEISGLQWRIDPLLLPRKYEHHQSKTSIVSGVSQDGTNANFVSSDSQATYKGTVCCLKSFKLDHKRQELSREIMKNMRLMREIKHRNVCPFIGAYVLERKLTVVTEYASRGSLEDILENEDIKLDTLFISSLVQDLLRAMSFLHQSFGPHGNLKSNNCVVTGRWVLQVTDYDLYELRYDTYKALERNWLFGEPQNGEDKKLLKNFLWKAPEVLNQTTYIPPAKEGDIYAFGIILHEIIGRRGPFSISDSNGCPNFEDIIEDVRRGCTVSGTLRRPHTLDLAHMPYGNDSDVLSAMKAAWDEDPRSRPDFKDLTTRLKKMKKSGNLMDHMVVILEEHNKNLEGLVRERTLEVFEEKKKTEELLYSMLPSSVAMNLCRNLPVEPQCYESVTIYFSDIVGFTALASTSSPYEIVSFLDDLYREFDTTVRCFDVYKVETIGDAYMVVSGLPNKNEGRHAGEIASMALELLESTKTFKIKHKPDQNLKLRIGLHTGPVIAGVVGHTMPRYCLFGDTVNTASRMESNGEPLRIHISQQCRDALVKLGGYVIEERGYVEVKGKGSVFTYWLNAATEMAIQRVEYLNSCAGFLKRYAEDGRDIRRRSPRHSGDRMSHSHRPSSICSQRIIKEEDGGSFKASYQRGLSSLHRQRLSSNDHSTSLAEDQTPKQSLTHVSPVAPVDFDNEKENLNSSCSSFRESCSLDHIPVNGLMKNPLLHELRRSSSPSSEPTLTTNNDSPRVNFASSKVANGNDYHESVPMLSPSCKTRDDSDLEDDKSDSQLSIRRASPLVKNLLQSFIPKAKRERLVSEKASIYGVQKESHV